MSERKIIQITATADAEVGGADVIYALCDDGSVWKMIDDCRQTYRKWQPVPMKFESPLPWEAHNVRS